MKKLGNVASLFLILFIIYYDLTAGSLPTITAEKTESTQAVDEITNNETTVTNTTPNPKPDSPKEIYQEYTVSPGETVLSIVEKIHLYRIPVSIEQIVYDFENLNPDVQANFIKQGFTYKFPLYPSPNGNQ